MEEIENVLGIRTCPMNWPIGINGEYKGVYDREHETIELFAKDETHGQEKLASEKGALTDPRMERVIRVMMYTKPCLMILSCLTLQAILF